MRWMGRNLPAPPPGFDPEDVRTPEKASRLTALEREAKAVEKWLETQRIGDVRKHIGASNNAEARVILNRGIEHWLENHAEHVQGMFVRQNLILAEAVGKAWTRYRDDPGADSTNLVRLLDRQAKLNDLDIARKPEVDSGPKVVIEVRVPWERDDPGTIEDGEFTTD
jgi:hypothetical protein